jgi:drug/metabolite transporter (DMT)-like permease
LLLRRVPLTIVQSSATAQFVGVIIAASLALGQPISPARWLGIACIPSEFSWRA